ncbi:hypothetical protein [Paraburkholderia sp. BL10I2N1]|uniref:phage adaptor protein n=1 Tax=Paraburkholderia sp. BL10I2N1 TaxID=1938796 RepID=UPI00105EEE2F|nr:hypothetical protein [Paraburkholderia sp. BL10I2N1]TDN70412.1 hypothetical protein B0G77_3886 [Paraburkholderia sp. BL10I2N1]
MSETYGFAVPFDNFLTEVTPYIPDVPEFVAINAIRNAVIEFCRRTRYWQQDLDPVTGVINVSNYEIDTPPNTVVVDVVEAWYNNVLLIPKSIDQLAYIYRTLDWRTLQGNPAYYTRIIEPELLLVPYPVSTLSNALTMRVALAPARSSTTVDSALYEHYLEEIAQGARARLYATHNQPYSDEKAAALYARLFRTAMDKAKIKVDKSLTRTSDRVEFQRFV